MMQIGKGLEAFESTTPATFPQSHRSVDITFRLLGVAKRGIPVRLPTLAPAVIVLASRAAEVRRLMPLLLTVTAAHTFSHG